MNTKQALEELIENEIENIAHRTTVSGRTQNEVKSFFNLLKAYIAEKNLEDAQNNIESETVEIKIYDDYSTLPSFVKSPSQYEISGTSFDGLDFRIIANDFQIKEKILNE